MPWWTRAGEGQEDVQAVVQCRTRVRACVRRWGTAALPWWASKEGAVATLQKGKESGQGRGIQPQSRGVGRRDWGRGRQVEADSSGSRP